MTPKIPGKKHDVRVKTETGTTRNVLSDKSYGQYRAYRARGASQADLSRFTNLHSTSSIKAMHASLVTKAMRTMFEDKIPADHMMDQWDKIIEGMTDREIVELGKGIQGKFKTAREYAYKHDMSDEDQVLKAQEKFRDIIGYADLYKEGLKQGLKPAKARTWAKKAFYSGL